MLMMDPRGQAPSRFRYRVVSDYDGKTLMSSEDLGGAKRWILEQGDTEEHTIVDSETQTAWFHNGTTWLRED